MTSRSWPKTCPVIPSIGFCRLLARGVSFVPRSKMILLAFEGHHNEAIERAVGLHHDAAVGCRLRKRKRHRRDEIGSRGCLGDRKTHSAGKVTARLIHRQWSRLGEPRKTKRRRNHADSTRRQILNGDASSSDASIKSKGCIELRHRLFSRVTSKSPRSRG